MALIERSGIRKYMDDAIVGFVRGTQYIHSLPSSLVTIEGKREWDDTVGRTKLEKVAKIATIAGESIVYGLLAKEGVPAFLLPAVTNGIDVVGYAVDKFAQADNIDQFDSQYPYSTKQDRVYWDEGAAWERVLFTLYNDLPI